MRRAADFLGLMAYLTIMYGRLPDRELLSAAYRGRSGPERGRRYGHLWVVPQSEDAARPKEEPAPAAQGSGDSAQAA